MHRFGVDAHAQSNVRPNHVANATQLKVELYALIPELFFDRKLALDITTWSLT